MSSIFLFLNHIEKRDIAYLLGVLQGTQDNQDSKEVTVDFVSLCHLSRSIILNSQISEKLLPTYYT